MRWRWSLARAVVAVWAVFAAAASVGAGPPAPTEWFDVGSATLGAGDVLAADIALAVTPSQVVGFEVRFDYSEMISDASWASDAQAKVTTPARATYTIGGFTTLPKADEDWSFNGPGSDGPGVYGDSGEDIFLPWLDAPAGDGVYAVSLTNDWLGDSNPNTYNVVQIRFYLSVAGACCHPDGTCSEGSESACVTAGGVYEGDGVSCASDPCVVPTGACCLPDGACLDVTPDACVDAEGVYQGDGIACAPGLCVGVKGACCFPDGSCGVLREDVCVTRGGDYQGDGKTCTIGCPPATGACCRADGTCVALDAAACLAVGGVYAGDLVACTPTLCPPPKGACCFPGGACGVMEEPTCTDAGGVYQGDGTICAGQCPTPPGACCFPDGTCVSLPSGACGDAGGGFQGVGVVCSPTLCPPPKGACCRPDGGCRVVEEEKCEGVYQGDGTICEGQCPPPLDGDVNRDGSVDFSDLLLVIAHWGPCSHCLADLDVDGVVGFGDLLMVLAHWG
ncbi:MAG: hypothetical protein HKO59_16245 [Phycisphaerales bacterium]|nr:hypothetical protein [Phycisphaerae bacterium]NNF42542.1 hypothetical protein [Phycisphaerales bacterium]NNM27503.1 hypothetical protein [Phycisphaerales bacterium]